MATAIADVRRFQSSFAIPAEGPAALEKLPEILTACPGAGKQVHDAYLVAAMLLHGIRRLMTLNGADFRRFAAAFNVEVPTRLSCSPPARRAAAARAGWTPRQRVVRQGGAPHRTSHEPASSPTDTAARDHHATGAQPVAALSRVRARPAPGLVRAAAFCPVCRPGSRVSRAQRVAKPHAPDRRHRHHRPGRDRPARRAAEPHTP
jgi:hypothetical protein